MPYKKATFTVSAISLMLVLTLSIVSCGPKTSASQNTSQEPAAGSAATTEAAAAANSTASPSSLTSQAEPESQSSSVPEDSIRFK